MMRIKNHEQKNPEKESEEEVNLSVVAETPGIGQSGGIEGKDRKDKPTNPNSVEDNESPFKVVTYKKKKREGPMMSDSQGGASQGTRSRGRPRDGEIRAKETARNVADGI